MVWFAMIKKSIFGLIVVTAALSLTACNPPLPPELQAELADNSINCGDAPISISAPAYLSPIFEQWIFEYSELCAGAGPSTLSQDPSAPSELVISASAVPPASCDAYLSVPVMAGATVIAASLQGLDGMVLDPPTLVQVLNGEITSWDDPAITSLNPQFEALPLPIKLSSTISNFDAEAVDSWLSRVAPQEWKGWPASFTVLDQEFDENNAPLELYEDGGLTFIPYWFASINSSQTIQIKVDPNLEPVPSTQDHVTSGVSQLTLESSESSSIATLDPTRTPLPIEGFDVPLAPWQAIVPVYAHACSGGSELDTRSFIRFMLRSFSQAALPNYASFGLPAELRGLVIESVSRGLPSPSPLEPDTAATP